MAIIKRPFYWANGNGGINIFLWHCGCSECDGSGNITIPGGTVPSGGGDTPTVPSSDDPTSLFFISDSGNSYDNLTFISDSGESLTLL